MQICLLSRLFILENWRSSGLSAPSLRVGIQCERSSADLPRLREFVCGNQSIQGRYKKTINTLTMKSIPNCRAVIHRSAESDDASFGWRDVRSATHRCSFELALFFPFTQTFPD